MHALRGLRICYDDCRISAGTTGGSVNLKLLEERSIDSLGPISRPNLSHNRSHDSILADLSSFSMFLHHVVDPDIADYIARNQDKVGRDDLLGVDFS